MDISENKLEIVINERKIIRFSLLLLFILFSINYLPFACFWGWKFTLDGLMKLLKHLLLWIIPIIILHEGLHGVVWGITMRDGFIQIKFGFNREMLAPYTHCKIPLEKWKYVSGGMAPLILMGIIPAVVSFFAGNAYWFCLSLFCIWSAAGDILSCYYVAKVPKCYKILDHPDKLGFILLPI